MLELRLTGVIASLETVMIFFNLWCSCAWNVSMDSSIWAFI